MGDGFGVCALERGPWDDVLCFPGLAVALARHDFPCEDDFLEVDDRNVVIVKFVCGMG